MSTIVVDSSVVAKWVLPEADSATASRVLSDAAVGNDAVVVLDLVFAEVANAIWKRRRQAQITIVEARHFLDVLVRAPVAVEAAAGVLARGFEIAAAYDRSVYDALFVALTERLGARGVTADEPLYNVVHKDFPQVVLLRNW